MENQFVFKRYEIKYLVTNAQRERLERAMQPYMVADEHGESTVCNVYYDTPSHLLIRRSCEKPRYKEKVRVRSYGRLAEGSEMFVELKKKYDGVVYKRRTMAEPARAAALLSGEAEPADQIEHEIAFTVKRYGSLVPACYIAYDRCAFFAADDYGFRITFDRNIRTRTERLSLAEDTDGEQLLPEGYSLMEVKCAGAMPLWLVRELTEMRLYKTSFSKYGTAWQRSGAVVEAKPAVVAPAGAEKPLGLHVRLPLLDPLSVPALAKRRAAHMRVA